MKHFKVLQYESVDKLADAVEVAINDGWDVAGQMFVSISGFDHGQRYNQPIIKTSRGDYSGWKDCISPECNDPCIEGSNYCKSHSGSLQ